MPGPIRFGLVGVGRWGRNYVRTIAEVEGAKLVAVASSNPDTRGIVPHDCDIFPDWRDLLNDGIDAIVIASPPFTHAEILLASVAAGKAVLVEKPLVTTAKDLAAIAQAVTNSLVMVEHTHLFHPAFRTLKAMVADRGRPVAIRASAGNTGPYRTDASVLWDWGPHDVAMALDLVSGPVEVRGAEVLERSYVGTVAAERIQLDLRLDGEVPCSLTLSTLDARHRWFAVDYAECTLIYSDRVEGPLRIVDRPAALPDADGRVLQVADDRPLTVAVQEFVAAVRGDQHVASNAINAMLALQVVDVLLQCEAACLNNDVRSS
jgi:predicted dehydrogenase